MCELKKWNHYIQLDYSYFLHGQKFPAFEFMAYLLELVVLVIIFDLTFFQPSQT